MSSHIALWIGVARASETRWMDEVKHGAWYEVGAWLCAALERDGFDVVAERLARIEVLDGGREGGATNQQLAQADDAFFDFISGPWTDARLPKSAAWRYAVKQPERAVLLDRDARVVHLMRHRVEPRPGAPLPLVPSGVDVPPGLALVATIPADKAVDLLGDFEQWDTYDLHGYERAPWEAAYMGLAHDPARTTHAFDLVDADPAPWAAATGGTAPPDFRAVVVEQRRQLALQTAPHFVRSQPPARLVSWIARHPQLRADIVLNAPLVPEVIEALLRCNDEDVHVAFAQRPDTHPALLLRVFKAGGDRAKDAVIEHASAPVEVFVAVAEGSDDGRRHRAAHHTKNPEAQLLFARHTDEHTRLWLAKNPHVTEPALAMLKRDASLNVRAAAAR